MQMTDDLDRLSGEVGAALQARRMMLVSAESCTGGGIGEAITRTAGSSAWFERGFVTYTNEAKQEMLGVRAETLDILGAVSEQTAREMALGALSASHAHLAVSVTGIAGPEGGTDGKPVGTVCFCWVLREGPTKTEICHFSGGRAEVRRQTIIRALRGVIQLSANKP
jgi:nicotinamide-nucleotide amidase